MTATFTSSRFESRLSTLNETPDGFVMCNDQQLLSHLPSSLVPGNFETKDARYPPLFLQKLDNRRKDFRSQELEHSYDPVEEKSVVDIDHPTVEPISRISLDEPMEEAVPTVPLQNGHVVEASFQTAIAREGGDLSSSPTQLTPEQATPKMLPEDEADNVTERASFNASGRDAVAGQVTPVGEDLPQEQYDPDQDVIGNSFADAKQSPKTKAPSTPRSGNIAIPVNAANGFHAGSSPRQSSPIIPASAGPGWNPTPLATPPISMTNKAVAQHPTYIATPPMPNPLNSVYSPGPPRVQEEVCIECAMRDQDMADVDVTSPGVWDRESDAHYQDLVRAEIEEEEDRRRNPNTSPPANSNRPKATGGRLTEQNLKVWLSMNPREPQAKQQTMDLYVKTQSAFLEAEALARARAMQESLALESKMKSTYDQWRRSTNDLGVPTSDELQNSRRPPRTLSGPAALLGVEGGHSRHPSRDITLLENGLVVEHVDVRKEEKEERQRRRKEERRERSRVRKSSRSSAVDVTSMYSLQTPLPHPDSGFHTTLSSGDIPGPMKRSSSRFSQTSSRPLSPSTGMPLTPPPSRPSNFRLQSQNSLSETQSISASSMARSSRFFGFKGWSEAWRSRDSFAPSGMSGSMVDMHVALDNEAHRKSYRAPDIPRSPSALQFDAAQSVVSMSTEQPASQTKVKKQKGLGKILRIFTGKKSDKGSQKTRDEGSVFGRSEDDAPLAPPPPLSYLVDRTAGERTSRHMSTVVANAANRTSYVRPTSHISNTPTSSRQSWLDRDPIADGRISVVLENEPSRGIHPVLSEPDLRRRNTDNTPLASQRSSVQSTATARPISSYSLNKSLPPLPGEHHAKADADKSNVAFPTSEHHRPMSSPVTVLSPEGLPTPQPSFRNEDRRRQSFGDLLPRPELSIRRTLPDRTDRGFSANYGEFGASRRSLGPMENLHIQEKGVIVPVSSRRKSKFGLSSLFQRFSIARENTKPTAPLDYELPYDPSCEPQAFLNNGTLRSNGSRRSHAPRLSLASRKAIEELVDQDPQFVAYRYPSVSQSIELMR